MLLLLVALLEDALNEIFRRHFQTLEPFAQHEDLLDTKAEDRLALRNLVVTAGLGQRAPEAGTTLVD